MTTRVGVVGSGGRMGSTIVTAFDSADDLDVVVRLGRSDDLAELVEHGVDVAVDVTSPAAVMSNIEFYLRNGIHCVIGTSGFDDDRTAAVESWSRAHPEVGVLLASNFSIGAVLMMRFAAEAARHFESVEIIESHHPDKVDAPSGTARRTAQLVGAARRDLGPMPDATREAVQGARGARLYGVPVHSIRARGVVAAQEVVLGGPGETLRITHDTVDRSAFVPGVLLAVRTISQRPGLTVGLEHLLAG